MPTQADSLRIGLGQTLGRISIARSAGEQRLPRDLLCLFAEPAATRAGHLQGEAAASLPGTPAVVFRRMSHVCLRGQKNVVHPKQTRS